MDYLKLDLDHNGKRTHLTAPISGYTDSQFTPVRDAFANLWDGPEVGASLCIYWHDKKVVHLWGGFADLAQTRPWTRDTLVNVYSTTKGIAALALAHLAETRAFNYQDPVSDYWPAFAAEGKGAITINQLLSHQAGLCAFEQDLVVADLYDWDAMVAALARGKPAWTPGLHAGYHSISWGFLAGALCHSITGKTLGQYIQAHLCTPTEADFHLGLDPKAHGRCADLIGPNHARNERAGRITGRQPATAMPRSDLAIRTQENPIIRPYQDACSSAWRQAEIPASNGHATAEGLAKLYRGALNKTLITEETRQQACARSVSQQQDLVLNQVIERSQGGFILNPGAGFGPNQQAFGHNGAGGSSAFADPESQVAFAYVMNQMQPDRTQPRAPNLAEVFFNCL